MSISMTEQLLLPDVQAASMGDKEAFTRLVKACQRSVSSIALAIVKDLDASEDITQQVFIHIWQQLNTLQNPASFLPWVRQTTRYRAFNYLRDNKVGRKVGGEKAEAILADFACDNQSSDDLADSLVKTQQNQIMADFISQLPADSREIVLLFYREEQNSQQVAELLGITESNVRKKLQRVRELLKDQLLAKYGKLILTTAPGMGLTTAICSALTLASPPVAAASASALAANSSGLAKISWLFGGAMIGALGGVLGVILGMRQPLKRAESVKERQLLLKYRNISVGWVLLSGILLALSYQFTAGALAPVVSFSLFLAGLGYLQYGVWQTIKPRLLAKMQHDATAAKVYRRNRLWCWLGMLGGGMAGYAGLISGLVRSNRWFWG
ncbi:RNA polymerase sigma factor, sigma-70 family [Arsukibacterium tuosuense]|uniref:RNA polymerase sigma factor, sigma-70 family n=1 Tax=Arsukibacterium tuosuense TaxID=1323745 RepID=A0A285J2U2_9GAMM|nr:sigma-70 family RNA polymerase sigma factor [Arsukibacterium tuosuense]SNY54187.1 RNA polymerase sigma factor, sigma-70 family [Arsukibacterium tuosuense]